MPAVQQVSGARKGKARRGAAKSGKSAKAKAPTKAERQATALESLVRTAERAADSIWDSKIALGRAILAADAEGVTRKRQIEAIRASSRYDFVKREMSLTNETALSKLAKIAEQLGEDAELQKLVGDLGLSNDDAHALASRMGRGLIRYGTVVAKLRGPNSDSEKKVWIKHVIDSGKMPGKGSNGGTAKLVLGIETKARVLKLAKANGITVDQLIMDALDEVEELLR